VWWGGLFGVFYEEFFYLVFEILDEEFFEPGYSFIIPTLWMKSHHNPFREPPLLCRLYNILGAVKNQALLDPFCLLRNFIAYTCFPTIPSAACVGEVELLKKSIP